MIVIKVQYQVKPDYVDTNRENIERVMADLRALKNDDIRYSAFLQEDGCTFMHFAMYPDEATLKIVSGLPSFGEFQTQLKASAPVVPPQVENYSLVASSYL